MMRLYRDRAVVLRQHKLGSHIQIVTLLTRDHRLVRAVAKKGVRRTRSKFGARLEPFALASKVQPHPSATSTSSPRLSLSALPPGT